MSSARAIEVVSGLYESFAEGDVGAVLAALDGEIEWREAEGMPYGRMHRNPDAVAGEVFGPVVEDFPDFQVQPEHMLAADEKTVAAIVRYRGTASATGRKLDLPAVHVWSLDGARIVGFTQFVDGPAFAGVAGR